MRIQPITTDILTQIDNQEHHKIKKPSFGLKVSTKIYDYGFNNSKKIDVVELKNGKKITIIDYIENGKTVNKLFSLKDKLNNWIKSKLKIFNNGKLIKVMKSKP